MKEWSHAPSKEDDDIILHLNGIADVRRMGWGKSGYEICVTKPGSAYSLRVGLSDDLDAAKRTADKLARYPRQSLEFAGF